MSDEVEVTPAHLHDAGAEITDLRGRMAEMRGFNGVMENAQNPYAADDAGRLSGAFFQPSLEADAALQRRSQEIMDLRADLQQNLFALASALHIVADVYTSADLEKAVDFAFVDTDAVPSGLPAYVDPDLTYSELRDEAEQEAGADAGSDPEPTDEGGASDDSASGSVSRSGFVVGGTTVETEVFYGDDHNPTRTEVTVHDTSDGTSRIVTFEGGEQTADELRSPDQGYAMDRRMDEIEAEVDQQLRDEGLGGT